MVGTASYPIAGFGVSCKYGVFLVLLLAVCVVYKWVID